LIYVNYRYPGGYVTLVARPTLKAAKKWIRTYYYYAHDLRLKTPTLYTSQRSTKEWRGGANGE